MAAKKMAQGAKNKKTIRQSPEEKHKSKDYAVSGKTNKLPLMPAQPDGEPYHDKPSPPELSKLSRFILERHLIKSFRMYDSGMILTLLYDLLYFAVLIVSLIIFMNHYLAPNLATLSQAVDIMGQAASSGTSDISLSQLGLVSNSYTSTFTSLLTATFVFVVIIILNHVLFQGLIWKRLVKKSYNLAYLWKSLVVTLFVLFSFIVVILLSLSVLKELAFSWFALLVLFPLFIHFAYITYPLLAIDDSLRSFFSRLFKTGVGKIYLFIMPYICILTISVLLMWLLPRMQLLIPLTLYRAALIMLLIAFLSWSRLYVLSVIKKAEGLV